MSTRRSKPRRAPSPKAASHAEIIQIIGESPDNLMQLGNKLWEAGLKDEASLYYGRALELAPERADTQEHAAQSALEKGDLERASDCIEQAMLIRQQLHASASPQPPKQTLIKLFDKLLKMNQLGLADDLRHLLATISPDTPTHHQMQLKLNIEAGKQDQALVAINQAIDAHPDDPNLYASRLQLHLQQQRFESLIQDVEKLVQLRDKQSRWNHLIGFALYQAKKYVEALPYALAHHEQNPDADADHLLGLIYTSLRNYPLARQHTQQALKEKPNHWVFHLNLGTIYLAEQQFRLAEDAFRKAMTLDENQLTPYINAMLTRAAQLDIEGVRSYRKAAEAHFPDDPHIYWTASLEELRVGNFEEGWQLYEYRWARPDSEEEREFPCPRWTGKEDLKDKTILVHIEQGFGDFIQMSRYSLMLHQLGARIILEIHGSLIPLMQTLPTSLHLVERGLPLTKEQLDYEIPIMSLPLAFNTRLDTIPYAERYLGTLPERVDKWQAILGKKKRPRIGLAWSGNAVHVNDHNRSIPLESLAPLFELPFDFHCLQHQLRESDHAAASYHNLYLHTRELHDFGDAAALADEMDLIISVDSAPAHLAAALGKPTWILLPYAPDFRWLLDRADSPWYPSAVLFRQTEKREWGEVINTVVQLLTDIAYPPASTTH